MAPAALLCSSWAADPAIGCPASALLLPCLLLAVHMMRAGMAAPLGRAISVMPASASKRLMGCFSRPLLRPEPTTAACKAGLLSGSTR